jgi:uncharacterized protein (DUF2384 family)
MKIEEQETVISFSRDSNVASLWTSDRTIINKLDKLVINNPKDYILKHIGLSMNNGEVLCKEYYLPKTLITLRKRKAERTVTEEQREKMRQRAQALHNNVNVD